KRATCVSMKLRTSAVRVTSAAASPTLVQTSFRRNAASRSSSSRRSTSVTRAPSARNSSAGATPKLPAPPATMQLLPSTNGILRAQRFRADALYGRKPPVWQLVCAQTITGLSFASRAFSATREEEDEKHELAPARTSGVAGAGGSCGAGGNAGRFGRR